MNFFFLSFDVRSLGVNVKFFLKLFSIAALSGLTIGILEEGLSVFCDASGFFLGMTFLSLPIDFVLAAEIDFLRFDFIFWIGGAIIGTSSNSPTFLISMINYSCSIDEISYRFWPSLMISMLSSASLISFSSPSYALGYRLINYLAESCFFVISSSVLILGV